MFKRLAVLCGAVALAMGMALLSGCRGMRPPPVKKSSSPARMPSTTPASSTVASRNKGCPFPAAHAICIRPGRRSKKAVCLQPGDAVFFHMEMEGSPEYAGIDRRAARTAGKFFAPLDRRRGARYNSSNIPKAMTGDL